MKGLGRMGETGRGSVEVWESAGGRLGLAGPRNASDFYSQVKKTLKEFDLTSISQRCLWLPALGFRREAAVSNHNLKD